MSWNIAKPGDQINGPVAVTGNLNVDSNTLFVDSANNRVGVLTASPTVPLDVVGDAKVSGNLTVDTNTLVVDAANNRLGIGTATPGSTLDINAGTNLNLAVGGLTLDNFTNDGVGITFSRTTDDADLMALGVCDTNKLGLFSREGLIFATGGSALYGQTSERLRIASDGVCTWSNVGGVAGTAMTLDASGGLAIGRTAAFYPLANRRGLTLDGSAGSIFVLGYNNSPGGYLLADASGTELSEVRAQALRFATNSTERARIDTSGNLLVGLAAAGSSSAKTVQIANGTAPTGNVTGGILYVENGALKYRGSSGTVTTIANA